MAIGRIPEPGTGIPESIVDAKGDIVTATAADTPARLAVGTNEHRLVAASGEATGLKYVADTTNYAVAAKGDLLVGTAADTVAVLSVGTNGHTLVADSSVSPQGLKWAVDPVADVITTAGDLIYGTAADTVARLGIGTAGQVLKVNSGATAPEWGAAGGASGLTKIASGEFSTQSSVAVDSVFSSTYFNYIVFMKTTAATGTDDLQIQFRYAGPTTQTSDYYGSGLSYNSSNTLSNYGFANASQATVSQDIGTTGGGSAYQVNFSYVGNKSENPVFWGTGIGAGGQKTTQFTCLNDAQRTYTGFLIKSSSTNISGFYAVYGLGN